MMPQQFDLLKASAITQIQSDLEAAVEADRIQAQTAASEASISAASSSDSASSAQASAIAAGAPIFADTTAGIAGTSSGGFFYVPEFGGLRTYENDAGTAAAGPFVSDPRFSARASLVTAIGAGFEPIPGTAVTAGGVQYVATAGATTITDMPGWEIKPNQPAVPDRGLEVIAHRGGLNVNVENTMPALTGCISWAQAVETDVVVSSDGVTRLFHDITLDSLTDGTGDVRTVTSDYLDTLVFTQLNGNPMQPLVRIPRFQEFLKWAVENDVIIYPEMKALRTADDVDLIVDEVLAANADKLTVLQSFSMSNTLRALGRSEKISCGHLGGGSLATMQARVDTLTPYPGRAWILVQFSSVLSNPEIVQYAADRLVGLGVWTVNTEDDFRSLREIGVNHIMTDLPLGRGNRYA